MEKKVMTSAEMIKLVSGDCGYTKQDVKEVIKSYSSVLRDVLLGGYEYQISGVGKFKRTTVSAKPERQGVINPSTGEKGLLPATGAYEKVKFVTTKSLKDTIKEETQE